MSPAARHALLVGWWAVPLTAVAAAVLAGTVIGLPVTFRLLSALPAIGWGAAGRDGRPPEFGWRC